MIGKNLSTLERRIRDIRKVSNDDKDTFVGEGIAKTFLSRGKRFSFPNPKEIMEESRGKCT